MNESIFNQMIDSFDSFVSVTFHELPKTKEGSVRCEDRRTTVNPNITLTKLNLHAFCACLSSAIVGNDSKHLCQGSNRPQLSKRVVHERNATGTQFDRRLEKTNNARKAKKRETHTDDGYIRDIPSRVMPLHNRD
jgi:hypothetical protein